MKRHQETAWFLEAEGNLSIRNSRPSFLSISADSGLGTCDSFLQSPSLDSFQSSPHSRRDSLSSFSLNTPTGQPFTKAKRCFFDGSAISPLRPCFVTSPTSTATATTMRVVNPFSSPKNDTHPLKLRKPDRAIEYRFDGSRVTSLGVRGLISMGSPESSRLVASNERCFQGTNCNRSSNRCLSMLENCNRWNNEANTGHSDSFSSRIPPLYNNSRVHSRPTFPSTSTPIIINAECAQLNPTKKAPFGSQLQPIARFPLHSPDRGRVLIDPFKNILRTPSPFKKAMARVERTRGRLHPVTLLQDTPNQVAQDLKEIIKNENCDELSLNNTTMNFNMTPSKTVNFETMDYSPFYAPESNLEREIPVAEGKIAFFKPPNRMPKPYGRRWMEITCGKTKCQKEITIMARQFLGLS